MTRRFETLMKAGMKAGPFARATAGARDAGDLRAGRAGATDDVGAGSLWRREDGSFIIFGLAIFMMMILAGGIGVDVMRYEAHRVKVQNTLDRAILAAAALDQTLPADDVVLDYFAKAGLEGMIAKEDIVWSATDTERKVSANVRLKLDTTFLRMAAINTLTFPAGGAAEEAASLSEISLVLDTSGSMGWTSYSGKSKSHELKKAAKSFVNLMLCNPKGSDQPGFRWWDRPNEADCTAEGDKISVNVVPYSEQVFLGETLLDRMNATQEHEKSACVTFYADDFTSVAVNADPILESDRLQRTGHFDNYRSANSTPSASYAPCVTDNWRKVTFLENNVSDLFDVIDALGADGSTSIDIGMKWGAALLDPSLQRVAGDMYNDGEIIADYASRPFNYDARGIEKVIVLMSDGLNDRQDYLHPGYHSGPSGVFYNNDDGRTSIHDPYRDEYYWPWKGGYYDHPYGAGSYEECVRRGSWWWGYYWDCKMVDEGSGATEMTFPQLWEKVTVAWYEQFSFTGNAGDVFDNREKNEHLKAICKAAKDSGILVFTIGFEVEDDTQDTLMRNCASRDTWYYDVNGLDIQTAFSSIAREISKLRLVN